MHFKKLLIKEKYQIEINIIYEKLDFRFYESWN